MRVGALARAMGFSVVGHPEQRALGSGVGFRAAMPRLTYRTASPSNRPPCRRPRARPSWTSAARAA